jgi:hypothetical protein
MAAHAAAAAASAADRLDDAVVEADEMIRRVRCLVANSLREHPNLAQIIEQKTLDSLIAIREKVDKTLDDIRSGDKRVKREVPDEKISDDDEPLSKRLCVRRAMPQAAAVAVATNVARVPVRGRRPAAAAAAASETEPSDSDDDLVDSDCDDIEQFLILGEPCETCHKLVTADGAHGTDRGDRCGYCINAALCDSDACRNKHWASPECQKAACKSMTERRRLHILDKDPAALLFKPECVVCLRAGSAEARFRRVCQICNWSRVCHSLDCMEAHKESCSRKYPQRAEFVQARRRAEAAARHRAAAAAAEAVAAASSVTTAASAAL